MTGYGSTAWTEAFIADPTHERFYGENNDRMPSFAEQLTEQEIRLVSAWLRGDWVRAEEGNKDAAAQE